MWKTRGVVFRILNALAPKLAEDRGHRAGDTFQLGGTDHFPVAAGRAAELEWEQGIGLRNSRKSEDEA